MIIARLLLAIPGLYLLIRGFLESRLSDGQAIEKQIYIILYAVGALLVLGGIFLPKICRGFRKSVPIRVLTLLLSAVLLFLAVTAGLIVTGPLFVRQADGSESALLVLGAPVVNDQPSLILRSRADLAAEWIAGHPDMRVIISGGKGGSKTEAETIADLLAEKGIDPDSLILEKNASTTEENFSYMKGLLGDVSSEPVAVLTNRFHVYRMGYFLKRQGYGNARFVMADTPSSVRLIWYFREVVLTIRYWFTGIS